MGSRNVGLQPATGTSKRVLSTTYPVHTMAHDSPARPSDIAQFQIALSNRQFSYPVDVDRLIEAARAVLRDSRFSSAAISIAVVDDDTIHELNRRHLDHDWPTDVLSFVLEERDGHLEGEVILSADTAASAAEEYGSTADREQLLYVIHGILHLVGYRDKSEAEVQEIRAAEARYLRQFGYEETKRRAAR
jgi:probable rRNA maturation factor